MKKVTLIDCRTITMPDGLILWVDEQAVQDNTDEANYLKELKPIVLNSKR